MPELPEVETTCRGIRSSLEGRKVVDVEVRQPKLRWPVPDSLRNELVGRKIQSVRRRAKYILIDTLAGTLMIHLGMSGRLMIVAKDKPIQKHDHVDVSLSGGRVLRFTDPRRFGSVHWLTGALDAHPLLAHLGPEPLLAEFDAGYLFECSRTRKVSIKTFIMDAKIVVGVGNIYANEALFLAKIHPTKAAGKVSRPSYERLVSAIKAVLEKAIAEGGTTLKDFVNGDGQPGYFQQELLVYGRSGKPCSECKRLLKEIRIAQRSTVYCPACQRK